MYRFQVFIALLVTGALLAAVHCRTELRRRTHYPSLFLEPPPPFSKRSHFFPPFRRHQFTKPQRTNNHLEYVDNEKPIHSKQPKWLWSEPQKEPEPEASHQVLAKSLTHDFPYADHKCNPCNSVPWIPIVGVSPHVPKQLVHQQVFPSYQHSPALSSDSYYSTINQLTTNLKPLNFAPPQTYPWGQVNAPVYPVPDTPHLPIMHHYANGDSAKLGDFWNSGEYLQHNGYDSAQEPSMHLYNASDDWSHHSKPAPPSPYVLSIDYPLQIFQTPLLDIPSVPLRESNHPRHEDLPPQPPSSLATELSNEIHPTFIGVSAPSGVEDAGELPQNGLAGNGAEDSKSSSSESKFSSFVAEEEASNATASDIVNSTDLNQLLGDFNDTAADTLLEYLNPPTLFNNPDDWLLTAAKYADEESPITKKKKQIQIVIPYTVNKNNLINYNSPPSSIPPLWEPASTTASPLVTFLKSNNSVTIGKIGMSNGVVPQDTNDLIRLQKAIDTWTVEGYSNHKQKPDKFYFQKIVTSTLSPSKEIPQRYLENSDSHFQHHVNPLLEHNDVTPHVQETRTVEEKFHVKKFSIYETTGSGENNTSSKLWEKLPVALSPVTKEKVYIVTPVPPSAANFTKWP